MPNSGSDSTPAPVVDHLFITPIADITVSIAYTRDVAARFD